MTTAPRPISLSDTQMSAVYAACEPLLPADRSAFLAALAHALRGEPVLGDGVVFRAIKGLQREFWRPPVETEKPPVHHLRKVGEPIA
jgi:hypothetical protein